jgi:hypothetical protein
MNGQLALQDRKKGSVLPASRFLQHAAVRPIADHTAQAEPGSALTESRFGQDFSRVAVHSESAAARSEATPPCPVTPTRCPFGGACHSCAVRVQTRLAFNQPGDEYEQEADRMAEQVMRMDNAEHSPSATTFSQRRIQRQANDEFPQYTGKADDLSKENSPKSKEKPTTLQRGIQHATPLGDVLPTINQVLPTDGGFPLEDDTRRFMEQRFQHNFTQVRVHTSPQAAKLARTVNARAYTIGNNMVFDEGQYAPETNIGRRLLAHELTHVVQQTSAHRGISDITIWPQDRFQEQEALRASQSALRPSADKIGATPATESIQRKCYRPADLTMADNCAPMGGDITDVSASGDELFLFRVSCDDFLTTPVNYEARLREFARGIHLDDMVSIHGFASEEGPPEFNQSLSCLRARKAQEVLSSMGIIAGVTVFAHGAVVGYRPDHRSVVVHVQHPQRREITRGEQSLLDRLARLGRVARSEGSGGADFAQAVDDFRSELASRITSLTAGDPLPDDVQLIMKALLLWSKDPGNQWGEGSWDSTDLVMSAPDYALVPASQYKCNAFVAEVLYNSLGVIQRVHESEESPGKYFPYRANEWGNARLSIPHFTVTAAPQMGDIWSNGSHTGIYLGVYNGKRLYISARDDGNGVYGLRDQVQREHGIQIKYMPEGGVYRRYTP